MHGDEVSKVVDTGILICYKVFVGSSETFSSLSFSVLEISILANIFGVSTLVFTPVLHLDPCKKLLYKV